MIEEVKSSSDNNQFTLKESQLKDYALKIIEEESKAHAVKLVNNLLKEQSKLCPEIIGAFCTITSNGHQKFATIPMRCEEIRQGDMILAIKINPGLFNLPPQFTNGCHYLLNKKGVIEEKNKDYYKFY